MKNIFPVEFPLLLKIGNDIVSQNQENYLQEQLSQETQNEDVRADEYVQHATYVRSSSLLDSNATEGKGDEKDTAGGLMKYQKSQIDQINLCNINYKDVARMILKTASLVVTSTSTSTPGISSAASESISFSRQNAGEDTEAEKERSFITKNSKGREKAYLDNEKSEKDDILNVGTERSIKKYEDVIQTQVEEQSCNEKRKIWMTHSSLSTTPPSTSTSISPSIPLNSSIAVARSEMKTGSGSGTGMGTGTGIGMGVGGKRSPASSVEKSVGMFEDRADIESSLQYRLSAVVRHIGINAFSGHYICDTYSSLRDLDVTVKPTCPSLSNPISSIISSASDSVSYDTPARGTTPASGKGNEGGGERGGGERGVGREGVDGSAGVWHRNNDSLVTEIKEIDVLTDMSSPYIFFYSRV